MVEATETARKPAPIWRCQVKDCTFSKPPTVHGYNQIAGHQLQHAKEGIPKVKRLFYLVDRDTGEVLAQTLAEARDKGLLELVAPKPEPKPEPELKPAPELKPEPVPEPPEEEPPEEEPPEEEPPEEEPKAKKGEGKLTEPQVSSDGIFKYTIALPSDAFTLFNLAKSTGLEKDTDKPFDEWIWDCITARYKYDYKRQLILAPLQEEKI